MRFSSSRELLDHIGKLLRARGFVAVIKGRNIGRGDTRQELPPPTSGSRRYFDPESRMVVDITPHRTSRWSADTQTPGGVQPVDTLAFLDMLEAKQ